jgi:cytochrome c peroxidase
MKKCAVILTFFLASTAFNYWTDIDLGIPDYFPKLIYDLSSNPLTTEKVELGRVLFYDPILSSDNTISCSSCHSSYNAFAHTDHDLSHGINDEIGTRNAPALFNLAWHNSMMWDGAIRNLDVQALAPMEHVKEMKQPIAIAVEKLQNSDLYPSLFYDAFQDSIVTGEYILKALAQFQLTLISATSKYDNVRKGKDKFTSQENSGYDLFIQHCNSCHTEPLFTNHQFVNNGLKVDTTLDDVGRIKITDLLEDSLAFKVPSLRNLSYTYPYMHDGRFRKLSQVLNHYVEGDFNNASVDDRIESINKLSSNEKVDIITFLLTLNDRTFIFDDKHQYPDDILLK